MDRRSFLRRSTLALAGGLLVGDAALEAFDRLTHRKVFALGQPRGMMLSDSWDFTLRDRQREKVRRLHAELNFVYFDAVTSRAGMALPAITPLTRLRT